MNAPFPFGFPTTTTWYLIWYIGTLLLHMILMNYVLAGSVWLLFAGMRGPRSDDTGRVGPTVADLLRDWMPFALGGAITAGVAPLLFVQILYQQQFYTANLLLFHRWMLILPVLIAGFYLLYIHKSTWKSPLTLSNSYIDQARELLRQLAPLLAFGCFAFVGYSWTENHLLSHQTQEVWSKFYGDRSWFYFEWGMLARLGVWFCGAFPTMLALVAWQVHFARNRDLADSREKSQRANLFVSAVASSMLLLAWTAVGIYYVSLEGMEQAALHGPDGRWYWVLAIVASLVQWLGWCRWGLGLGHGRDNLWLITFGVIGTMLPGIVARELLRIAHVDKRVWEEAHANSAIVGGATVFVFFLAFNTLVIAWCLWGLRGKIQPVK